MTVDQARRRKTLARWHRRLAMFIFIWLMVLAVSGVLINHAHDWGLDQKHLSATLQRFVYGIENDGEDFCRTAAVTGAECAGIFARLPLQVGTLLLAENSLFLLDDAGQLVEKLAASQMGLGGLQAGYREGSRVFLRDVQNVVRSDAQLMDWVVLQPEVADKLNGRDWQVRGEAAQGISWERFILDLHAARFLGPLAKIFNDLMAGFILVLVVSGAWLYRQKRKGNGNGSTGPEKR